MNEMTVLKIVVGASMPRPRGLSGAMRLQRQHDEAEDEQRDVEDQQREDILLPVLRAGVEQVLEPLEHARRAILAVHDPGEIAAERDRQHDRRQKK